MSTRPFTSTWLVDQRRGSHENDLLCVLVEQRLPVQVDVAARQTVSPGAHLEQIDF